MARPVIFEAEHDLEAIVYRRNQLRAAALANSGDDPEPGSVVVVRFQPGSVAYSVCWADASVSSHYGFELTTDPEWTPPDSEA